jgi:peroxiredoxin
MLKQVLKRLGTAMVLVVIGLASVVYFMKSSKPEVAESAHKHATSEDHKECAAKIVGKELPGLALRSTTNAPISVEALSQEQPVIVIRYLGYGCSHCIEQLLALQKLSATLKAKRIRVIAFSDDTPEQNQTVMTKYGFDPALFTLASDPAKASAYSLGAVYPETDGTLTELHVSMVVQRGRVNFAHFDSKPMMDVQALLAQVSGLSYR